MPDRMNDLLRGSSLDPAHLYVDCEQCRLAGRGNRIARDPFNGAVCVYGHRIDSARVSRLRHLSSRDRNQER